MSTKPLPNAKDYDRVVAEFIDGKISFDQFVNASPPIPPPPSVSPSPARAVPRASSETEGCADKPK